VALPRFFTEELDDMCASFGVSPSAAAVASPK
jgi:hypothetical protein